MQKSVHCLRLMGNIQNVATLMRRYREETNCRKQSHYFNFLCVQKVFSSLHKIQIEPLIADVHNQIQNRPIWQHWLIDTPVITA